MTKWADRSLEFKIANNLRTRLNAAIRNKAKVGSAVSDLGCSIEELIIHLEKLFLPGMTWGNKGKDGWHIDHIIPLARFDLTDKKQFLQACHYTNLQPMWAKDNAKKGTKIGKQIKYINIPKYIKPLRKSKVDISKLKILFEKGKSSYKIADELNCSPTNIRYWVNKLKLRTSRLPTL